MAGQMNPGYEVDPPEDLHKIGKTDTGRQVGSKWINQRQQSPLVTDADRNTGEVSKDASNKLQEIQNGTSNL